MAYSYSNYFGIPLQRSAEPTVQFWATPGSEPIYGTGGADLVGGAGAAGHLLSGGAGDDTYHVFGPLDRVVEQAGEGVDTVVVGYTDFTLPEAVEHLILKGNFFAIGNAGPNIVEGDAGAQHIIGRGGDDVLIGGRGPDVFVFAPGSGYDALADFDGAEGDKIRLQGYGFTSFDQLRAAMTQVGPDVSLRLSGADAILLRNHQIADFQTDNFQIGFDPRHLTLTFEETFDSLSLYNPATGEGVWRSNFWYGAQTGPDGSVSRALADSLFVDPSLAGLGDRPLGLNPFSVHDGVLDITASRTPEALKAALWNFDYVSGALNTEPSFAQQYGYFEMRAQLPTEKGMFPAFWLMPDAAPGGPSLNNWPTPGPNQPNPPEIDIVEQIGGAKTYHSLHTAQTGALLQTTFENYVDEISEGFHTYGVLWTAKEIAWFVDGVQVGSVATPADMHSPMHMIVNLSVGGDWAGAPDADFITGKMTIDYIRVYSVDPNATANSLTLTAPPGLPSNGPDTLHGGQAADLIEGRGGDDVISNDGGRDTLSGGEGSDRVSGSADGEMLMGGQGRDTLDAGGGDDSLWGGRDDDLVIGGSGQDYALGDLGDDRVLGQDGDDTLSGGEGADSLLGADGKDLLFGGPGDDTLQGGLGDDFQAGDDGADLLINAGGRDYLYGGAGADTLYAGAEGDLLLGNQDRDVIFGGAGADVAFGGQGDDHISGGGGNDNLSGDLGNDTLDGGEGADILTGGVGADRFVFRSAADSAPGAADHVADFLAGQDLIDVSAIDADPRTPEDDAFVFVQAFSGRGGEAMLDYDPAAGVTRFWLDFDGDGRADFALVINGYADGFSGFIL